MTVDSEPRSAARAAISGVVVCVLLTIALVLISFLMEGRSRAERTATELVMPMGLLWMGSLCMSVVMFRLRRPLSGCLLLLVFLAIGVTGNAYVASRYVSVIEWPEASPIGPVVTRNDGDDRTPPFRAAVVLGGGQTQTESGVPEVNESGERIVSAAQLWHAGQIKAIICTGADPSGLTEPSKVAADLLVSLAVPAQVIFTLDGENTQGEMKAVSGFLEHPPAGFPRDGQLILITSAYHMRRAMRLARRQGLEFDPHPCAYQSTTVVITGPYYLVPKADALVTFSAALKEQLAALVGR